jgi:hypothetical protein
VRDENYFEIQKLLKKSCFKTCSRNRDRFYQKIKKCKRYVFSEDRIVEMEIQLFPVQKTQKHTIKHVFFVLY